MSSLSLDPASLATLADAYAPNSQVSVTNGRLTIRPVGLDLEIALDRISAGAVVTYRQLSLAITRVDATTGVVMIDFNLTPAGKARAG